MIKAKIVSSLEKALTNQNIDDFDELETLSVMRGERVSVQLLHTYIFDPATGANDRRKLYCDLTLNGDLKDFTTLRDVRNVPIERPVITKQGSGDNYITYDATIIPDLLEPLQYENLVNVTTGQLFGVWVEINIPKDFKPGQTKLEFVLDGKYEKAVKSIVFDVIDTELPKEDIYYTQWFHCDCLASYYNVKMWSKRHWEIVENFARVAVKNGINMILTPTFTPPLDTKIGGERPTCQLVGVTLENGKYSFDFKLLDKWIRMCKRVGIKYFEIAHLYTQWGCEHAPKVMATVDGVYKKIFGWETQATSDEYRTFLREYLTALLSHMKEKRLDKNCFFHISDEPNEAHLESYKAAKEQVADILKGYTIMDALSNYDFWQRGICDTPIPSNNHIAPFIEGKVPNLWTYYCCSQQNKVSNRLIAMPSCRNRSIGYQMFKYDIVGFLQWGYNFYYNYLSVNLINPFLQMDGNSWVPAGDAFSVYPSAQGEALESLRIIVFHEALTDLKAMKLCAKLYDKETVVKIIDEEIGTDVTFDDCAYRPSQILNIRQRVNALIKAKLTK